MPTRIRPAHSAFVVALFCSAMFSGCLQLAGDYVREQIAKQQAETETEAAAKAEPAAAPDSSRNEADATGSTASGASRIEPQPEFNTFAAETTSAPTGQSSEPASSNREPSIDELDSLPALSGNGQPQAIGEQQAQSYARAASSDRPPIHLSTGVALPQSLPTGTAMGFSVEYRGAAPVSSAQYMWVIRSPKGEVWQTRIQMGQSGTLQTFVPEWGPVAGTYETFIDEVTRSGRTTISKKLPITYNY